jgi:hypothetical protein
MTMPPSRITSMACSMDANMLTAAPAGGGGDGPHPEGTASPSPDEQPLDVLGDHVGFEVDAVARLPDSERGDLQRVRDEPDPETPRAGTSTTVRLTPSTVTEPFGTR